MAVVMGQCGVGNDWIPGLQIPLTIHDLRQGREHHNNLSYGTKDQDQNQEEHLESLRQLLEEYKVQDIFGLVDKHKHFDVPHDCHLAGQFGVIQESRFYLVQTVADQTSDLKKLCGHKFTYIPEQGQLLPYQFYQAPLPDISQVDPKFFSKFIGYLDNHKITSIGLEYIIPQISQIKTHEFSSGRGKWMILIEATLSLKSLNSDPREVTSWRWLSSKAISGPSTDCQKDVSGNHVGPEDLPPKVYLMLAQISLV
jgi:hypothetical protein